MVAFDMTPLDVTAFMANNVDERTLKDTTTVLSKTCVIHHIHHELN